MYKVLNIDWDVVCVDSIDARIHRHLSGRAFNDNDTCVMNKIEENTLEEWETQEVEKQKRGRKKK